MNQLATVSIIVLLCGPAGAAAREVIRTDWSGLQQQVAARKLTNRSVLITPATGTAFKTKLISVSGQGLVVQANRATQQWAAGGKEANIPRDQIGSVRFSGRMGHRGLIGGAVGLGAGAAIAAAIVNDISCDEVGCLVLLAPAIAVPIVGAVGGYFIGRATAPQGPEFVLTQ